MPTTRKMSARHEEDLADILSGQQTRNSGAVWSDQGDGHQIQDDGYWRFVWDGKATLGKSISVTREMWDKINRQSRNLLPMIPLRWYQNERLTCVDIDLIAVDAKVFAQMRVDANNWRRHQEGGDES